jgi:translation initiation factor IF-1
MNLLTTILDNTASKLSLSAGMKDAPIVTEGKVISRRDERTFCVELKNGKQIIGHTELKMAHLRDAIVEGDGVRLEMTTFDFEKGRITEILPQA